MTYTIAMQNDLVLANYHIPTANPRMVHEFLHVSRVSSNGEFLFVTEAGESTGTETVAPDMLQLGNTLVGSLIRVDPVRKSEIFILNRSSPVGPMLPGRFFPGDGLVEMFDTKDGFVLQASGRHDHSSTPDPMTGQVLHTPEPIPNPTPSGRTWLFDAIQIEWAGTSRT